jgi:ribitol-5-phosphate 2-dehydrogenase
MLSKSFKIVEPKRFDLYIEDVRPAEDEAIVKVEYGAICKADLRYYLGARDKRTLGLKYPMNLIHEAVGIIVADKTNTFKIGERVVLSPNIISNMRNKCENCVCDIPELGENYCPQAKFASSSINGFGREYVNYPVSNLIKIPLEVDMQVATFTELISVSVATYRRLKLSGKETLAVWGDGILGYILSTTLKYIHKDGNIIAVGKHEDKLKQFPVDKFYLIGDKNIQNENINIAYECVGGESSGLAINEAIDNISVGGNIILTGVAESVVGLNTRKILEKGISLHGVTRSSNKDFEVALGILTNKEARKTIKKLVLSEVEIKNIIDYYKVFEKELYNKKLGKNVLKFEL